MVYLDYSATTPVEKEVLDYFVDISNKYIANPNSLHELGKEAKEYIDKCSSSILELLNLKDHEVIYTSGSSEANNLAIKGLANKYKSNGKHIITTYMEHPSITAPFSYLQKQGFTIDIVNLDSNGIVDLEHLKSLLREDTILVSIGSVNSELGMLQPISEIASIVSEYTNCHLHSDITQSVGKVDIDYSNIDLLSFSAHKFYGLKGIGALIKRKGINLTTMIHGGHSTTTYRSGTPPLPLIGSLYKSLQLATTNIEERYQHVKELNEYLTTKLDNLPNIKVNSNSFSIPHIFNVSILNQSSKQTVRDLEKKEIYISNHTACSSNTEKSLAVYSLTKDELLATTCVRISLSHLTSKEDIDKLISALREVTNK